MTHRIPHGAGAEGPDGPRWRKGRGGRRLGGTVARLVGEAEVTGRVQVRAADLLDKAGAMTVQLCESAGRAGRATAGVLRRRRRR
ncbi:hypothetical protein AQI95_21600 [Streptomyces yokosukanensis]|uniref:Uncharacterized protein n=1 Tax=Streptomyces yokosukanensis TaxID=67386 RepID=A0A117Q212_9ACTN|nr:hypothetical protein [Streptomyces yokosukanensis]KUN04031.1 hypothetical protein AQI95_21600 [Streptomyces yokosukanensis]